MPIGILTVEFRLSGCHSLKEKRRRLSGLRDRLGRRPHLAVCESDFSDSHQQSQWTFVALAATRAGISRAFNEIEQHLEDLVDAEVIEVDREEF